MTRVWFKRIKLIRKPYVLGVFVVAVIAVVAVTAVLIGTRPETSAGDVDATSAPDTPIPAVPTSLGDLRFSIDVPFGTPQDGIDVTPSWLAAGGSGFLVGEARGVRAYDGAGVERWHYRMSGQPDDVTVPYGGMRVYDDGRTVVLHLVRRETAGRDRVHRVVALDAITGEQLWSTDDADDSYPVPSATTIGTSRFMIVDDGLSRTRIDTRTGKTMWTLQLPERCRFHTVESPKYLAYVAGCATGLDAAVRLISADVATGTIVVDRVLDHYQLINPRSIPPQSNMQLSVGAVTDEELAVSDYTNGAPVQNREYRAINLVTGQMTTIGRPWPYLGDPRGDVMTFDRTEGNDHLSPLTLRTGADLAVKCALPETDLPPQIGWLGTEVVKPVQRGAIVGYDRRDCTPGATREAPADGYYVRVIPAPGVLLAVRSTKGGSTVDGYRVLGEAR
jgi:hypothetical protein